MHAIFLLPAVSVLNIVPDYMHIIDLGLAHHILGNVMFELVYEKRYCPTKNTIPDRLAELWRRITNQYSSRRTPVQLGTLELSWFSDTSAPHQNYPVLTSRVKAAETRLLPT